MIMMIMIILIMIMVTRGYFLVVSNTRRMHSHWAQQWGKAGEKTAAHTLVLVARH